MFSGDLFRGMIPEGVTSAVWRFGFHERLTSIFILGRLRLGSCFIDIGAHFGYYTILASRAVGATGRIVAIEPNPETFLALQRNISLNELDNVSAYEIAAFSGDSRIEFIDFGIVYSALNTHTRARSLLEGKEREGKRITVGARRVDDIVTSLNIESVDMIKIDAESSEEEAIHGLRSTIERDKPLVIVEMGGASAAVEVSRTERIFSFMRQFGYLGFSFNGEELIEITDTQGLPYLNVVFEADR